MSDTSGNNPANFTDVVAESGPFSPEEGPEKRIVEFVGRVFSGSIADTFTMSLLPDASGVARVIEANSADVVGYDVAFEDSAGRRTYKVRVPEDATVKVLMQAVQVSGRPNAAAIAKPDVK